MSIYYPQPNTRVVVAKFPMGSVAVGELLELGKPFGTIVKHLVFPAKVGHLFIYTYTFILSGEPFCKLQLCFAHHFLCCEL